MTTNSNKFDIVFPWEKDIRPYFNYYISSFLNIFQPSKKQIRKVEESYNKRYQIESNIIKTNGVFESETTMFDLFWQAKENETGAIAFLKFIEDICASLINKLAPELLKQLRSTCFNVVINFDNQQSRYLCFIGELALLDKILSSDKNKLIKIEYELPNGKSFDFAIRNNSKISLIEVTNIFLETELFKCEEDFHSFANHRFVNKLADKLNNIPEEEKYSFGLLPLFWGKIPELRKYYKYINNYKAPKDIVLPMMTIFPYENTETGEIIYNLLTIKQFLTKIISRTEKGCL